MTDTATALATAAKGDQFIFVLDDSKSMQDPGCNGVKRFQQLKDYIKPIAEKAVTLDSAVDLIVFGDAEHTKMYKDQSPADTLKIIESLKGTTRFTDAAFAIRKAEERAIELGANGSNTHVIFVTDGDVKDKDVVNSAMQALKITLINGKKLNVTYVRLSDDKCMQIEKTECETGPDGTCKTEALKSAEVPLFELNCIASPNLPDKVHAKEDCVRVPSDQAQSR